MRAFLFDVCPVHRREEKLFVKRLAEDSQSAFYQFVVNRLVQAHGYQQHNQAIKNFNNLFGLQFNSGKNFIEKIRIIKLAVEPREHK